MFGFERPPRWAAVTLLVGALVLAALVAFARVPEYQPTEQDARVADAATKAAAAQAAEEGAEPKRVAFLGDSYTGGSHMDSGEAARWPALVSAELNWAPDIHAVGGTGYLSPGQTVPFGDRLDDLIRSGPDIVIVAGGTNDAERYPAEDIGDAALDVFQRLREGLPDVPIIVVGPFHPSPNPPPQSAQARDAIRSAMEKVHGATFIDPLPWFTGGKVQIGEDGVHPTDAGHREIADRMIEALATLGYPKAA